MGNSKPSSGATVRDVRVGLCGFTMPAGEYPDHFPVVEVQQTFYQPPTPLTMSLWRHAAPADFEFTIKAWQLITHAITSSTYRRLKRALTAEERATCGGFRDTPIVQEGWKVTLDCARLLHATAILFQCPASFRATPENVASMREFFGRIGRVDGTRLLWEPRGPWPDDLITELCSELELVHVVDPFERPPLTRDPVYVRLHGITGARHVYSDTELQKLEQMLPAEGTSYVMFNNLPRVGDARRFTKLISARA